MITWPKNILRPMLKTKPLSANLTYPKQWTISLCIMVQAKILKIRKHLLRIPNSSFINLRFHREPSPINSLRIADLSLVYWMKLKRRKSWLVVDQIQRIINPSWTQLELTLRDTLIWILSRPLKITLLAIIHINLLKWQLVKRAETMVHRVLTIIIQQSYLLQETL
jgi:hypothetical protein